jgi:large subunit ribosomal protein L18
MSILRHERLRKRVHGTPERPRLSIFRSNKHVYAQVIDDSTGRTLAAADSRQGALQAEIKDQPCLAVAQAVGKAIAANAKAAGVAKVVFDRGGF